MHNHYDAILILGYPTNSDGTISRRLQERCDYALSLYQKQIAPHIIVSGSNVKNEFNEAEVMKEYLLQKDKSISIKVESQARNTYQNFKNTKADFPYSNILIVTSPSHIRRTHFFAKKFYSNSDVVKCKAIDQIKYYLFEYTRLWICLYYEIKLSKK